MCQLHDVAAIKRFTLAGNATLTLRSTKTGNRFTYRVRSPRSKKGWFVSVLTGPDNEASYSYVGFLINDKFRLTQGSKFSWSDAQAGAFKYFTDAVLSSEVLPSTLEVRHAGKCGRCGRTLTVPESIDSGIGPECAKHVGLR